MSLKNLENEIIKDLKIAVFIKQNEDRLFQKIEKIEESIEKSELAKRVKDRERSLLFLSDGLPLATNIIQIGSEPKYIRTALDSIRQTIASDEVNEYSILSAIVLLYILEEGHKKYKDDPIKMVLWGKIHGRAQNIEEETEVKLKNQN